MVFIVFMRLYLRQANKMQIRGMIIYKRDHCKNDLYCLGYKMACIVSFVLLHYVYCLVYDILLLSTLLKYLLLRIITISFFNISITWSIIKNFMTSNYIFYHYNERSKKNIMTNPCTNVQLFSDLFST